MNFSVLISAYCTENPKYLDRALHSIWDDQILKPNQIVLVKDGPMTEELNRVMNEWQLKLGDVLSTVSLQSNVGLGEALRVGIHYCKHNLVARMDTDDISLPDRFLDQIRFFKDHSDIDVVGSNVSEFSNDEECISSYRLVPQAHEDIVRRSKFRNPFNHPSVMYKKSAVINAGGPKNFSGFDDLYLWVRMIKNGSKCENIQKVLLKLRAGSGLVKRRGGFNYLVFEYKFQRMLFRIRYINFYEFMRNLSIRLPLRMAPFAVRKLVYRAIRRWF